MRVSNEFQEYLRKRIKIYLVNPEFWLTHIFSYVGVLILLNYINAEFIVVICYGLGYLLLTPLIGLIKLNNAFNKELKNKN